MADLKPRAFRHWTLDQRLSYHSQPGDKGCLLWTAVKSHRGYGLMRWMGRNHHAHRLAWTAAHGPVPSGMMVCHKCDVRHCINPDHLFLGTAADNSRDMVAKGRQISGHARAAISPRGSASKSSKLTEAQAMEIFLAKGTYVEIAKRYGLTSTPIRLIKIKKTWRHIHE